MTAVRSLALIVAVLLGCTPEVEPPAATPPTATPPTANPPAATAAVESPPQVPGIRGRVVDPLGSPIPDCAVCFLAPGPTSWEAGPSAPLARSRTGPDGRFALHTPPEVDGALILVEHPRFPSRLLDATPGLSDLGDLVLSSAIGAVVEVVRADSSAPVAGALVTVEPALVDPRLQPATLRRTGRTAPDGRVEIYGLRPGTYRVRVEAAGLAVAEVDHAQPLATVSPPRVRVRMAPGFGVAGRVLDADGQRVVEARVEAISDRRHAASVHTRTGDDGTFRLAGLAEGRYQLEIDDQRGRTTRLEVEVPCPDLLMLTLGPPPMVTGRVVTAEDGRGIADAEVHLRPASPDGGAEEQRTRTGPDGRFTFPAALPGRYQLWTSSKARVSVCSAPLDLPAAEPVALILQTARSLRGAVRDANGRAMPDAEIEVMPEWFDGSAFAAFAQQVTCRAALPVYRSGRDGSFEVVGPTAPFRLLIRAPGHAPRITQPIAEGDRRIPTVHLETGGLIRGTVRGPGSGLAPEGGVVCADPAGDPDGPMRLAIEARTGPDGRFSLGPLSAGPYEVFYCSPARERLARELARDRTTSSVRIEVRDGHLLHCDLHLR